MVGNDLDNIGHPHDMEKVKAASSTRNGWDLQ